MVDAALARSQEIQNAAHDDQKTLSDAYRNLNAQELTQHLSRAAEQF